MPAPSPLTKLLSGRYRVLQKLGEGGMGVVYLAADEGLNGRKVVVKMPLPGVLDEPGFAARFALEIDALIELVHPHVVKIEAKGIHDGVPFCVMQYLEGGNLHERPIPADVRSLRRWLPDVAKALDFIHSKGMLHRDIKPANILFDRHGSDHVNAYVSDFGVAKVLANKAARKRGEKESGEGDFVGTVGYLPWELLNGAEEVTGAADQYSFAATVYQVLAGRLPFEAANENAIILLQSKGEVPPLRQFARHVPKPLADAVERGLRQNAADRYPTCVAFADAIVRALETVGVVGPIPSASSKPTPGGTPPPAKSGPPKLEKKAAPSAGPKGTAGRSAEKRPAGKRGHRKAMLFAAVVILAGAGVGGWFGFRAWRAGRVPVPIPGSDAFSVKPVEEVVVEPGGPEVPVLVRAVRRGYSGPIRLTGTGVVGGPRVSDGTIDGGQNETTVRAAAGQHARGRADLRLKVQGDRDEFEITIPVRVQPRPEMTVRLKEPPPPLRAGEEVTVRVRVERNESAKWPARFVVNEAQIPRDVIITPVRGSLAVQKQEFDIRIQAGNAPSGFTLPIVVYLDHPKDKLERAINVELHVIPAK